MNNEGTKLGDYDSLACGADACGGGGCHEWGTDLVEFRNGTTSIVCEKCGMSRASYDLWTEI